MFFLGGHVSFQMFGWFGHVYILLQTAILDFTKSISINEI